MERIFPGTVTVQGREFLFMQSEGFREFRNLFPQITQSGDSPLPRSGGAINEEAVAILPDGKRLYCLSFRGDLLGWRRKIVECAQANQLVWGELVEGINMKVSDGNEYPLDACELAFSSG